MKDSGSPERASIDQLRALQLERLQWTLHHAYRNVTHYRRSFDARGVHPDDLRGLEDIARFPLLTKQDFRDNYPFGLFAVPREKVVRVHASSGTTGRPTAVGYTQQDIDTWADLVARSIRAAGGRPGHVVHIGYGLFTGGLGAHYGAERLGCTVIPMSGGQTMRQAQLIRDFRPDIIMVTPRMRGDQGWTGHLDTLTVHVECVAGSSDQGSRQRAAAKLASQVKAFVGISVEVEIHTPGSIERSTGKAKRLRDGRRP